MWDVTGIWLHEPTGGLLEFRPDGTYEMKLPNPFTGTALLRNDGYYAVIEGVIYTESFSKTKVEIYLMTMPLHATTFRFMRNGEELGDLTCVRVR